MPKLKRSGAEPVSEIDIELVLERKTFVWPAVVSLSTGWKAIFTPPGMSVRMNSTGLTNSAPAPLALTRGGRPTTWIFAIHADEEARFERRPALAGLSLIPDLGAGCSA